MSLSALAVIGLTVLGTSFLSGIFGMAGGMILLGMLLFFFDVVPAMMLFGVIQGAANGWRALLWRAHVEWHIVWRYIVGALIAFVAMRFIAYIPDKAVIYIAIGILPFLAELLPQRFQLDITRPSGPYVCGVVILTLQLMAGGAGHILDMFFQRSKLDRRGIVGTKAIIQTLAHGFRILYFGSFTASMAVAFTAEVPWWAYIVAIALAFTGTTLASFVLERMTDANFRIWTRRIIQTVATVFLTRGLWLLWTGG
jgi:uncharacterized membrane protein YfcA